MANLNKFQKVLFWWSVVGTLGFIFVMAWIDGIKPYELMEYSRT